jgi:L-amino acid N-acyltransferase YncA
MKTLPLTFESVKPYMYDETLRMNLLSFWTLQASIFPENVASIALHRTAGFREVGRRERIGKLNGVWRTTVLMERRSIVAGTI